MSSTNVGVRIRPEVLVATREALGLPADTKDVDTIRAALSHLTGVPVARMTSPRGGDMRPHARAARAA